MRVLRPLALAMQPAIALLGGCQSVFGISRAAKPDLIVPKSEEPQRYAAAQLEEGRRLLDQQQYGLAIIAFRNSQRFPELAAASHNGLAISYAQLGREDLAERYFRQAIVEAPEDARYRGNLARFEAATVGSARRIALAWQKANDLRLRQQHQQQARLLVDPATGTAVRLEMSAPRIVKLSAREVFISSATGTGADPRRRNANFRPALATR